MKKLFSLSWFKSEKQKLYESLVVEEQQLKVDRIRLQLEKESEKPIESPFLSTKFVNNTLTVVLKDGSILSKPDATIEDFRKIRDCKDEQEIINVLASKDLLKDIQQDECDGINIERIVEGMPVLKKVDDFEVRDSAVYLKGVNRTIPALLVDRFIDVILKHMHTDWTVDKEALSNDIEYTSLKKFWLKCCLNPSAQSAEDLYLFLSKHNMKIDRHGNFYAYRRVVKLDTAPVSKELVDAISNGYNKIKAVWKKNPIDYEIFKIETGTARVIYEIHKSGSFANQGHIANSIGNLKDLYLNLPNMKENRYTDDRTHKCDYRVGNVISMPRYEGDDNNQINCSKGFHQASKEYDYSGFGDTPILSIINPVDVLAVPVGEIGKLRVCRWFFAMTLPEDEKYILDDDDFDVTELGDVFEERCLENMGEYVQNSFAEEVKRHTFFVPTISAKEVESITSQLSLMKEAIDRRITKF